MPEVVGGAVAGGGALGAAADERLIFLLIFLGRRLRRSRSVPTCSLATLCEMMGRHPSALLSDAMEGARTASALGCSALVDAAK